MRTARPARPWLRGQDGETLPPVLQGHHPGPASRSVPSYAARPVQRSGPAPVSSASRPVWGQGKDRLKGTLRPAFVTDERAGALAEGGRGQDKAGVLAQRCHRMVDDDNIRDCRHKVRDIRRGQVAGQVIFHNDQRGNRASPGLFHHRFQRQPPSWPAPWCCIPAVPSDRPAEGVARARAAAMLAAACMSAGDPYCMPDTTTGVRAATSVRAMRVTSRVSSGARSATGGAAGSISWAMAKPRRAMSSGRRARCPPPRHPVRLARVSGHAGRMGIQPQRACCRIHPAWHPGLICRVEGWLAHRLSQRKAKPGAVA